MQWGSSQWLKHNIWDCNSQNACSVHCSLLNLCLFTGMPSNRIKNQILIKNYYEYMAQNVCLITEVILLFQWLIPQFHSGDAMGESLKCPPEKFAKKKIVGGKKTKKKKLMKEDWGSLGLMTRIHYWWWNVNGSNTSHSFHCLLFMPDYF